MTDQTTTSALRRPLLADAGVAVAVCAYTLAEVRLSAAGVDHLGTHLVAALLMTLPLAVRRRRPLVPAIAFAAGSLLDSVAPTFVPSFGEFVAGMLATYSLAAHASRRAGAVGGAALAAAVLLFLSQDPSEDALPFGLETLLPFAAVTGIGLFVRHRRTELRTQARAALTEERTRISRELHDLVGHAVSLMTVQAGVARVALDGGDETRLREALGAIEGTGREALDELRRLLGILRAEDEATGELHPQPGVDAITGLVRQMTAAGRKVDLRVEGNARPLPAGLALTAYRITQEALTNVVKHAGPAHIAVVVRYRAECLELEISDDGAGASRRAGAGHGLIGMRERAALYGGDVFAGPSSDGGFSVRTQLPLPESAS